MHLPLAALLILLSGTTSLTPLKGFDLPTAMRALFGNYDPATGSSTYDVPQSNQIDLASFHRGDKIAVRPFWIGITSENGTRKVVLLFYSVPLEEFQSAPAGQRRFDCHACVPLVGAAVFLHTGGQWAVESSRTAVSRAGGWGQPPGRVRIINIGPRHIGIEMIDSDSSQGQTTETVRLLIPWREKINEALSRTIADDDKGICGDHDSLPCYANRVRLKFVPGANPDYYDLTLTRSGTDMTEGAKPRIKLVHGLEKLYFKDGSYVMTEKHGDTAPWWQDP